MSKKSNTMHVRLKPYNPKRGHVLRKWTDGPSRMKFEESMGWYLVDANGFVDANGRTLVERLGAARNGDTDPNSPLAFDVCTEAEAKEIDKREAKEKERRDATTPTDLTTRDLAPARERSMRGVEEPPKRRGRPPRAASAMR